MLLEKEKSFQVRIRDKGIRGSLFVLQGLGGRRGRGELGGGGSCREVGSCGRGKGDRWRGGGWLTDLSTLKCPK